VLFDLRAPVAVLASNTHRGQVQSLDRPHADIEVRG
jgi:hypothetical protein